MDPSSNETSITDFKADNHQQYNSNEQMNDQFTHDDLNLNYVYGFNDSMDSCSHHSELFHESDTSSSIYNHQQYPTTMQSTLSVEFNNLSCTNANNDQSPDNSANYAPIDQDLNAIRNQNPPQMRSSYSLTDSLKRTADVKDSILLAVSQLSLCDIPLKREIYESLTNTKLDGEPHVSNNFHEFMKIENSPTLFKKEHEKLEELKEACLLLRNPYKEVVNETKHLPDAIQVTEAAIRRLIKMSNKLSSFNRLIQSDQIALLKSAIIEMFCIRATTNFNSENNFWYFIDDQKKGLSLVSMEVLTAAQVNYLSHKEFAIKFNSQFRNDLMIADLLTAIILFRPSRAAVSNPNIVKEEFLNYCYLLRRYLQVKHKGESCVAKNSFLTLMNRLEELYYLSEEIVHIYLDMNPQNAGQLFVELFDLK